MAVPVWNYKARRVDMAEHESKQVVAVTRAMSPEECFDKAAAKLLELDDEVKAAHHGYEDRATATEWRRLGQAIRGDVVRGDYTE